MTLTYSGNGGTCTTADTTKTIYLNTNSTTTSSQDVTLPDGSGCSRTGYTFKEWMAPDDETAAAGATYNPGWVYNASSFTFDMVAVWTANTYKIAYTLDGGTAGSSAPTTATFDSVINISNPTKEGYTFAGWTANANLNVSNAKYGTSSTNVTTSWTSTSTKVTATYFKNLIVGNGYTVTLTANWTANTYTVNYYNGSTKLGSSSHTYGTAKTLTTWDSLGGTITNSSYGWSFAGWSTSNANTTRNHTDGKSVSNLTSTAGGTVNLYAVYSRTITFKSGVASATSSTATQYWNPYGTTNGTHVAGVSSPALTTITDWTSLGYRNDTSSGAKEYSASTTIYPSVSGGNTLYGVYSYLHTVNFYSGVSKATTVQKSATAYYNTNTSSLTTVVNITFPAASECTDISNWTELGWRNDTTAGASEYAFGATISTNLTTTSIYATYSRTLTVSYNGNSSTSGSTSSTTKTVYMNTNSTTTSSQAVTLASNGFTKTGYNFSKWAAGGTSGTQYAAGASYTPGVAYNASTFGKTMYAIWTAKVKSVSFAIAYDSSTYPAPSSTLKAKQSVPSATSVSYGSSVSVTAQPAVPADRYTGTISCTNGLTASISHGTASDYSATTDVTRSDTVKVTNNSNTETASVCTITYKPKWKGIPYGTYTAGDSLASSDYASTTYGWTVKVDNGNDVGLAYRAVAGSGPYADGPTTITTKLLDANTILSNDKTNGGLVKLSNGYYASSASGISTGLESETYNYWVSSTKFYNVKTRNRYDRTVEKFVRGVSNGRSNTVTAYEDFTKYTVYPEYTTTKIIDSGIQTVEGTNRTLNDDGTLTFTKNTFDSSAKTTTEHYYSKYITEFSIWGATTNSIWYLKDTWRLDDNTTWNHVDDYSSTIGSDGSSFTKTSWRTTHWVCGGTYHGKRVVYRYNKEDYFYYGNEGTETGWPAENTSFTLEDAKSYAESSSDGYVYQGNYAGFVGINCSTRVNCPESGDKTIDGYTRYHRYFHYNTYVSSGGTKSCSTYTHYTDQPTNYSISLYYRPYVRVRER